MDACKDAVSHYDADTILRRANSSISDEIEQQLDEALKLIIKFMPTFDDPDVIYKRISQALRTIPIPHPPDLPNLLIEHHRRVAGLLNDLDDQDFSRKRKLAKMAIKEDNNFEKSSKSIYRANEKK